MISRYCLSDPRPASIARFDRRFIFRRSPASLTLIDALMHGSYLFYNSLLKNRS